MPEKNPQVFVRESTGLVKNVSILHAVSMNLSGMDAGAVLGIIGLTMVLLPSVSGVNLVYASIIAAALSLPQMIVYSMMTSRMPRTGGDYVWLSRNFGSFWGSTIAFAGLTMETMAFLALIVLSTIFAIGSVGLALGYQGFLGIALPGNIAGSNPALQVMLGIIIFALIIGLNIVKPKWGYRFVSTLMVIGIAILILAVFVLLSAGRSGVVSYMNSLHSIGANETYASIVSSFKGSTFDFGSTIFILPFFAMFVYPWFNAAPAVGSELKGRNTGKWSIPLSTLITFIIVTASFATMYYVGGFAFINGALSNPQLVYSYSFNFWTLAMGVTTNTILQWTIGAGWILWNVAILAYGVIYISRYLFAQAFDRFLPQRIAYVSPKYASPVVAHLIDLILTVSLVAAAAFLYGPLSSLFGAIVGALIYLFFVEIAVIIYAFRHEKGQAKGVLAFSAVLAAGVFLYVIYQFFSSPAVWGGNPLAYGYLFSAFVIGVIIYFVSKTHYAKKGIDITLVYKEIPPE